MLQGRLGELKREVSAGAMTRPVISSTGPILAGCALLCGPALWGCQAW